MTPTATVTRFIELICLGRLEEAAELTAEDITYHNLPMPPVFGRADMAAVLGGVCQLADEVDWVVHHQAEVGTVVLNERTDRFRRGDHWYEIPVMGSFTLSNGLITRWSDYFDLAQFTERFEGFFAAQ
ncbi:MAG TPA: limonene-1,2-epoxide hydrolase [Acidimicrobiaceae bacterium]|jgi:limonene-1,2-epoxide hydrolase|nr:limonene-1,2-epoxide hydrolase [Acidimicrobiaceae bacterium]